MEPSEDLKLVTFIQKHGHDNWRSLPKQAGLLRCGKSCRLRWINYLRPDVKRGNFTAEEEDAIIKLHQSLGNKWSKIASCLPGRTDNEIKNVWHTHLKKKLAQRSQSNPHPDESSISASPSCSTNSVSCAKQSTGKELEHQTDDQEGFVTEAPHGSLPDELSSSSISYEHSNFLNSEDYHQMGSFFEFTELSSGVSDTFQEVDKPDLLEIHFPSDTDIWSLLDGLETFQDSEIGQSFSGTEAEAENQKWFKYLENELGLEEDENQKHIARNEDEKSPL